MAVRLETIDTGDLANLLANLLAKAGRLRQVETGAFADTVGEFLGREARGEADSLPLKQRRKRKQIWKKQEPEVASPMAGERSGPGPSTKEA
jgi:hypothetical protein